MTNVAKNWEEYSSVSPEHKSVEDAWRANYVNVPGSWSPGFYSWVNWYNQQKREWGTHKGPSEVAAEISLLGSTMTEPIKRERKILNVFRKNKDLPVIISPGVDIDNISNDATKFLDILSISAQEIGVDTPVVTSGRRSPGAQARAMAKNWVRNGGESGGMKYLNDLYADDEKAMQLHNIFMRYGPDKRGIFNASNYLKENPMSAHQRGEAIDLRYTPGIRNVLSKAKSNGADIRIVFEDDHVHVKVNGIFPTSSRLARLRHISKLANS